MGTERLMKFDAWWTARGPMHLGMLNSEKSFCGLVESLSSTGSGAVPGPWYDSDTHETSSKRLRLHVSDTFRPAERYCRRCARHALKALEDA